MYGNNCARKRAKNTFNHLNLIKKMRIDNI